MHGSHRAGAEWRMAQRGQGAGYARQPFFFRPCLCGDVPSCAHKLKPICSLERLTLLATMVKLSSNSRNVSIVSRGSLAEACRPVTTAHGSLARV